MNELEKGLKAAAVRGVPIVFVRTQDQPDCAKRIGKSLNGGRPVVVHDSCRGFTAGNESAQGVLARIMVVDGQPVDASLFTDPQTALTAARGLPKGSVLICYAADRWLDKPGPAFAALLLRDKFQGDGTMLVCLGTTYGPASELGADVVVIEDPPPDAEARTKIIESVSSDAGIKVTPEIKSQLLTYTKSLSSFACVQTVALAALSTREYDMTVARKIWEEQINATPGLSVLTERPTPEMVAGLAGWTAQVMRLKTSRTPIEVVIYIDEIEKNLAGASGASADSSGSSQQVLNRMLTTMEDSKTTGSIFLGPPGTGKSLAAQVAGAILGVPTIAVNPSNMKGGIVGDTERNSSRAFQTVRGLGNAFWIATCNGLANLPPELLRRFTTGIFFFDLPTQDELTAIWAVHLKSKGFKLTERWKQDEGYTGADVRNVVRDAWAFQVPVSEIAKDHVPSSRASSEMTGRLRQQAIGAYKSAQYPGAYRLPAQDESGGRKFDLNK